MAGGGRFIYHQFAGQEFQKQTAGHKTDDAHASNRALHVRLKGWQEARFIVPPRRPAVILTREETGKRQTGRGRRKTVKSKIG